MSLRTFIIALSVTFGVAWFAVVVIPYFKMRDLAPVAFTEAADGATGVFFPKRTGRIANGAEVYGENGCYLCHTQVVRPTYAGNDMFRDDWGGLAADPDRGDTRRETNAWDFEGETFAYIGEMRVGPDLSNVGRRVQSAQGADAEAWLFTHLYNAQEIPDRYRSTCPPMPFLFKKRAITGSPSDEALDVEVEQGFEIVPGSDAKALVSYLLSLKKDQAVPAVLNFAPAKTDG
ncbi:MAG: hypothetical protein ACQCXQ_03990 [Verrucomicrobiales bacterium]|nr:hypothetical protein [Verrucomicrobiota bacterium JB025]